MPNRTTRGDHCTIYSFLLRLKSRLFAIAQQVFAVSDARARRHGWQVTVTRGGFGRRYRDPRFDFLMPCPACSGRGCNPHGTTCSACHGTAASSWIQPPFRSLGEGSHDSGTSPVSRQPRTDRPAPPHLRRGAQPPGRRLEVALRDSLGVGTGGRSCCRDQFVRRCADDHRSDRRRSGDLVLAARPAVRSRPRLVRHYSASSARRLRRRADLLQPRRRFPSSYGHHTRPSANESRSIAVQAPPLTTSSRPAGPRQKPVGGPRRPLIVFRRPCERTRRWYP